MNEPVSLQPRPDRCAVLTPYSMGRGGGNCEQPPIVEARWRFPFRHHTSACCWSRDQYPAERPLAYVSVGMLYDARVED